MKNNSDDMNALMQIIRTIGKLTNADEIILHYLSTISNERKRALCNEVIVYQEINNNCQITGNILSFIAYVALERRLILVMEQFLLLGADVNAVITVEMEANTRKLSLLQYACRFGNKHVVKSLFNHGANPLIPSDTNDTLLHFSFHTYDFFKEIIQLLDKATRRSLIVFNAQAKRSIFNHLLQERRTLPQAELLCRMEPELYHQAFLDEKAITMASDVAFETTKHQVLLQKNKSIQSAILQNTLKAAAYWYKDSQFAPKEILENKLNDAVHISENQSIRAAIAQFNLYLFNHETNLRKMLSLLSSKLLNRIVSSGNLGDYFNLSQAFEHKLIRCYIYPIPTIHFEKTTKHKLLPILLIDILRSAGLAQTASKWYGFLPKVIADEKTAAGEFFIESPFGLSLLHGKYSHMIQWALMVLAVENKLVALPRGVTVKQVITRLSKMRSNRNDDTSSWEATLDMAIPSHFTFNDPYRTTSLISTGYFGERCRILEVYLRDSFCADFLLWFNAYNKASTQKINIGMFVKILNLVQVHVFPDMDYTYNACKARINEKLAKLAKGESISTRSMTLFDHPQKKYIIAEKDYSTPDNQISAKPSH